LKLSLQRSVAAGLAIGISIYIIMFYVIFGWDFNELISVFLKFNVAYLLPTLTLRMLIPVIHSLPWYFLLRIYRHDLRILKVIAVMLTALSMEFIVPIGGVTEVVKVLLATQLLSMKYDEAISSIFAHRLLLTVSITVTTLLSTYFVGLSPTVVVGLLIPALGLLAVNIAALVIPSTSVFERFVNSLGSRFGITLNGFSHRYRGSITKLINEGRSMSLIAFALTMLERLASGLYGVYLCRLASVNVNIFSSLLAFDSIYVVIWLLPLITPGNLGIFEALQTMILRGVGVTPKSAAVISFLNRVFIMVGTYPLLILSLTYLGIHVRGLVKKIIEEGKLTRSFKGS